MSLGPTTQRVLAPSEAAARLGVPVPRLVALLRRYRYAWTELSPGGRPGDRGRNRWGLTEEQLQKILDGQRRDFAPPPEPAPAHPGAPRRSSLSPDGISRLRKRSKRG